MQDNSSQRATRSTSRDKQNEVISKIVCVVVKDGCIVWLSRVMSSTINFPGSGLDSLMEHMFLRCQLMQSITASKTIENLDFAFQGKLLQIMDQHLPVQSSDILWKVVVSSTLPHHHTTHHLVWLKRQSKLLNKLSMEEEEMLKTCYLLMYQITPHTTTGKSPAELLIMGRCLRSCLDLYFPEVEEPVVKAQNKQKRHHQAVAYIIAAGDKVFKSISPK